MTQQPILYKQAEAWGLPSASVACIQVEAYLRFTGMPFIVESCTSISKSPTGQVPAVEKEAQVAGLEGAGSRSHDVKGVVNEYHAARTCLGFSKLHCKDLDQHLSNTQKAELLAYSVLIETRLEVATAMTTWCEPLGFAEMQKVMGQLPFPLSYVIPWTQRREVRSRYQHLKADEVYAEAVAAILALADRLRTSGGPFFFGSRPSSLDALLLGHLLYYRLSPAVAPVLQHKVANQKVLCDFVDYVMREYFAVPALPVPSHPPQAPEGSWGSSSWSDAAKGQKTKETKAEPTPAERQFKRNSRLWLLGAGAAIVAYVLLSGQYVKLDFSQPAGGLLADDDDDDGDDDQE